MKLINYKVIKAQEGITFPLKERSILDTENPQILPPVQPAQTVNQTFSQQFQQGRQAALKGGPKVFTWRGKSYGTQLQGEATKPTQAVKPSTQELKNKVQSQSNKVNVVPQIATNPNSQKLNDAIGYRQSFGNQNVTVPQQKPLVPFNKPTTQNKPIVLSGPTIIGKKPGVVNPNNPVKLNGPTITGTKPVINPKNPIKLQGPTIIGKKKRQSSPNGSSLSFFQRSNITPLLSNNAY